MAELFTAKWMTRFQTEWNADKSLCSALAQVKFNSNIGYGVIGESAPRGVLKVTKGQASAAGEYNGEELNWDLRAKLEDWGEWFKNPPGMMDLGMAYTSQKLKFAQGDYASMIKDPAIAGPFVKSFQIMARV